MAKVVKEGLDRKLVESCLNSREFSLKEGGGDFATKGVLYALEAMNGWLYDGDPLMTLRYSELLQDLKAKLSTDYYERYIETHLLNNPFSALLHLMPKKGLSEERDAELAKKLEAYK
ncbi:insulinase family protein, partial [Bacillus licheniformis]